MFGPARYDPDHRQDKIDSYRPIEEKRSNVSQFPRRPKLPKVPFHNQRVSAVDYYEDVKDPTHRCDRLHRCRKRCFQIHVELATAQDPDGPAEIEDCQNARTIRRQE